MNLTGLGIEMKILFVKYEQKDCNVKPDHAFWRGNPQIL